MLVFFLFSYLKNIAFCSCIFFPTFLYEECNVLVCTLFHAYFLRDTRYSVCVCNFHLSSTGIVTLITSKVSNYANIVFLGCFNNNDNNNRIPRRNSRLLQSPHCTTNCLQHVRSSGPGAIVCKSRATHPALINAICVTCHVVRRDSSAIKFDRVEIAFIGALFYWLNH